MSLYDMFLNFWSYFSWPYSWYDPSNDQTPMTSRQELGTTALTYDTLGLMTEPLIFLQGLSYLLHLPKSIFHFVSQHIYAC